MYVRNSRSDSVQAISSAHSLEFRGLVIGVIVVWIGQEALLRQFVFRIGHLFDRDHWQTHLQKRNGVLKYSRT